ncbi:hypothetical protein FACS1894195_0420 [Bacteroidia bacterium]|nr:hypothetical protein FACS1894195_0420 [Bacteroidia bacterium]
MIHSEENLQIACVEWFSLSHPRLAVLLHHSPNGGYRNVREAVKFKKMGTRAGFPDLILCLPNAKYHGACFELKSPKGVLSDKQKEWGAKVVEHDYYYAVVYNVEQFIEEIKNYLSLT